MILRPPRPPLFPYTTLFRSGVLRVGQDAVEALGAEQRQALGDVFDADNIAVAGTALHPVGPGPGQGCAGDCDIVRVRSEEHTSELQSHSDLVCRLLLEKKK